MRRQFVVAIIIILVVLDVFFRVLKMRMPEFHITALLIANYVMAALSLSAYALVNRQLDNRPQAFVRGVFSATFLKLIVCMVAILAYVLLNREHIHKPSVFMMFGIYVVYSVTETILLSKVAKEDK